MPTEKDQHKTESLVFQTVSVNLDKASKHIYVIVCRLVHFTIYRPWKFLFLISDGFPSILIADWIT